MGLDLEVGILSDLRDNDAEGYGYYKSLFEKLEQFLSESGHSGFREPEQCDVWSCDMYGYSGLHYLRRVALSIDLRGKMPTPGTDELIRGTEYNFLCEEYRQKPSRLKRLWGFGTARTFSHLLYHSDCEGFYIPLDLASVLFPPDALQIPGCMIGSVQQLQRECGKLSAMLEIPSDLDPESEEVLTAPDYQGQSGLRWRQYGVESFTCIRLLKACSESLRSGAAIVFC